MEVQRTSVKLKSIREVKMNIKYLGKILANKYYQYKYT